MGTVEGEDLSVVSFPEAPLDRRPTRTPRARCRGGECYLCDQAPETIDHLLCDCPFTREVWFHICQAIGCPLPSTSHSVLALVEAAAWSLPDKQAERDGLAIRFGILGNMERAERPLVQGDREHGAGATANHQSAG